MNKSVQNHKCELSRKRQHRITIRLNDNEYRELCRKVEPAVSKANSKQQILIGLLLKGTVITKNPQELEVEIRKEQSIRSVHNELIREGKNINDIAKRCNAGQVSALAATSIKKKLSEIETHLKDIKNGINQIR